MDTERSLPFARRGRALAVAASLALVACAFVGRAVLSADDGAEILSDTLGFLVQGRFESATMPPRSVDPFLPPTPPFRSRYGLIPSLLPLPFVAPAWALRRTIGAAGVDAAASLTWAAGTLLASLGFLRLVRALRPGASPLWAPALVGGTFLWSYAADSYVEPWAAAGLAFAGAAILSLEERSSAHAGLAAAAGCVFAFWLRTVAWTLAPVIVLAALLAWRGRVDAARRAAWLVGGLAAGLALVLAINRVRHGSALDFGYGFTGAIPFVASPWSGLLGSTVLPGRGVFLYAPLVLAALVAAPRLSWPARVLCYGAPIVLLLVATRWFVWHGGTCWGPRFLLPALPLLAAPAVLAPRRAALALVAIGFFVNLPGVLVAPGAFQAYVERLVPPAGARWPAAGGDRVSDVALLTPLYGHPWLLARAVTGRPLAAPWLSAGARETAPAPAAAGFLSPLLARRAIGLPPVSPFVPRLLVRSAAAYLLRGRPAQAALFARAALEVDPAERDAPRVLAAAERALAPP